MFLQLALSHSFCGWVISHCIKVTDLYPFFCQWHLGWFHVLAIVNSAAVNSGVHVLFWTLFFSGLSAQSGITGSSTFSFSRSLHTVLHSGEHLWTHLYFHGQCRKEGSLFSVSTLKRQSALIIQSFLWHLWSIFTVDNLS